jgi:DNA-directed RNA polymerase subunit RPC12/RpoP
MAYNYGIYEAIEQNASGFNCNNCKSKVLAT